VPEPVPLGYPLFPSGQHRHTLISARVPELLFLNDSLCYRMISWTAELRGITCGWCAVVKKTPTWSFSWFCVPTSPVDNRHWTCRAFFAGRHQLVFESKK